MLTLNERNGLKDILDSLNEEELFGLFETVTSRMIVAQNRSEATEIILKCTDKPTDLLQRQRITKKIILSYLIVKCQNVVPVVNPEWGKMTLVQKCLELWQSTDSAKERDVQSTDVSEPICPRMGIEFSKWFFNILNTLKDFGPLHFWPSCILSAELWSPMEKKEISLTGASDVASFLRNLITLDDYKFGANDTTVKIEMEPHGLVKIIVHGVLYQHSNCVGLFDFAFGLVRNPDAANNYKIQIMKLKMQVNCGSQVPVGNQLSLYA